jgi:hypothetical protein
MTDNFPRNAAETKVPLHKNDSQLVFPPLSSMHHQTKVLKLRKQQPNPTPPHQSSFTSHPQALFQPLPRTRPIDNSINPHIHTRQSRLVAPLRMISLMLRLIRISATPTHGVVAVRAARVLTGAVCIIFSLHVVDANAAVIGVLGIVRTASTQLV